MGRYATLDLESTFPFGKYKDKPVSWVIEKDPGYLLWLREEKWKDANQITDAGFGPDIHALLDIYLETNLDTLSGKYRFRTEPKVPERQVDIADTPVTAPELAPEAWGAW